MTSRPLEESTPRPPAAFQDPAARPIGASAAQAVPLTPAMEPMHTKSRHLERDNGGEPVPPTPPQELNDSLGGGGHDLTDLPWPAHELVSEHQVYGAMSQAVISRTERFLRPLQSSAEVARLTKSLIQEEFFPRFKGLANQWTDECCHKFARIVRLSSRFPIVRDTPEIDLVRRIRETAFKPLDAILLGYADTAKHIEVIYGNIRKIQAELMKAAESGPPAQEETVAPHPAGRGPPPAEEWATDRELIHQETLLFQEQWRAFAQIIQYLKSVNELPAALLSYAGDKCFGVEGNYRLELAAVNNIKAELRPRLAHAIETLERAGDAAKTGVEQQVTSLLTNIQLVETDRALETLWVEKIENTAKTRQKRDRISLVILGVILVLAAAYLYYMFSRPWRGF